MIRPLTEGETALAREAFGEHLECGTVRFLAAPWPFNRAFVPGRWFGRDWIVWPRRNAADDLSAGAFGVQAVLVHELVHIWQAQQGVNLLLAKLKAGDDRAAYVYPMDHCQWRHLNIEQQASAVEHAFRLSRGGAVPGDAAFYRAVAPFPCGLNRI